MKCTIIIGSTLISATISKHNVSIMYKITKKQAFEKNNNSVIGAVKFFQGINNLAN